MYGSGLLTKGPGAYPRYMYNSASTELLRRVVQMEQTCQRYGVQMATVSNQPDAFHGDWNYPILPPAASDDNVLS